MKQKDSPDFDYDVGEELGVGMKLLNEKFKSEGGIVGYKQSVDRLRDFRENIQERLFKPFSIIIILNLSLL